MAALLVGTSCGGSAKASLPASATPYSFVAEDGLTLQGHLFGSGPVAVILAHAFNKDESSWYPLADDLARRGFQVLTFNFRGFTGSQGTKDATKLDLDVAAAVKAMREQQGAMAVFLVGASLGGTASLKVAARERVAGVVTLSALMESRGLAVDQDVPRITAPKLFLASQRDTSASQSARDFTGLAQEPKQTIYRTGDSHGADMLKGDQGSPVKQAILQFLLRYRPQEAAQ